jgi:hypothetical protein
MSFEVGQKVECRGGMEGSRGREPKAGTVVKVARKYCTVEFPTHYGVRTGEFDKETGIERGDKDYPQHLTSIKTPEEWAAIDCREDLIHELLRHGVDVRVMGRSRLPLETIEALAEVMGIERWTR